MIKTSRWASVFIFLLAGSGGSVNGQTVTNLHSFAGSPNDGASPQAGLAQGSDGNFYGTTYSGGASTNCSGGCGTVFKVDPNGKLTTLHSFSGSDGENPSAGLVQGSDGNFYCTTSYGGNLNLNHGYGFGTIFKITSAGTLTTLYQFSGTDGADPVAGLVQGSDGNFYGTTESGGSPLYNQGTVFGINSTGTLTYGLSFAGYPDPSGPYASLVQGTDGYFYGTTEGGGSSSDGTVFKFRPGVTWGEIWDFTNGTDGANPVAGLVRGSDGNFYGTTSYGGSICYGEPCGGGTVFRISSGGALTAVYTFSGPDGESPNGLIQGSDGNFYGTGQNGPYGGGVIFRISPGGNLTNLWSFSNDGVGGNSPQAGLVQGSDGNFYGTTSYGGNTNLNGGNGFGTLFRLTVPFGTRPNQICGMQFGGANVILIIPSVEGETYQLQYRNSMTYGSWSNVPVSVTNSIGALMTLTNFGGASQSQGFYRVAITP